ncbi:MAG: LysM peptidoglycan-binding domain-containing protein [Actinobacteria bacterium]|nr:LysM peptidoglycan-binding domain-containing protein [Actinomycetota bacterium]
MGSESIPGPAKPVGRGVRRARPSRELTLKAIAVLLCLGAAGVAETTHIVVRGDNLSRIAKRNGTTVSAIAEANGISDPNLIVIGKQLRIPGNEPGPLIPAAATSNVSHAVAGGENLSGIAAMHGVSVGTIVQANGISNPNRIRAGQVLTIPKPGPPSVEDLMERYAREYGVNPALVKGLAWQESGWKQHVVSSAGAIGVMQVIPETGVFTARRLLGHEVDLNDLEGNVKAGVRFLAYLLKVTGGDENLAVAGYFQGLRSVRTRGMSPKTERYVANVMALKARFGG